MLATRITWRNCSMAQLDVMCLFHMFQLRQAVFILEQRCLYPDIDAHDEHAIHVLGTDCEQNLIAYLRILAPGIAYEEPTIGRVVVADSARGVGNGRLLVEEGIRVLQHHFGNTAIRISAQSYLIPLYQDAGFKTVGDGYLEDNIPHQQMLLPARTR